MGVNYYIGRAISTGGTISNEFVEYSQVLVPKSGGTFTGTVIAPAFSGDGSNITNTPDSYTTGATLVGTTVHYDRTDTLSAYTVDLSSLAGGGPSSGNTYVTASTWTSSANTLTLTRNDDIDINVVIDSFSGLTFDGMDLGDSQWKNWSQWYTNGNTSVIPVATSSTPILVANSSATGNDMGIVWSTNTKGFSFSGGTLMFTGDSRQEFHITVSMTVYADSNNQLLDFYIRKNNVDQINLEIQGQFGTSANRGTLALSGIIELDPNDDVELWFENNSSNKDVTINYLNFSIVQI